MMKIIVITPEPNSDEEQQTVKSNLQQIFENDSNKSDVGKRFKENEEKTFLNVKEETNIKDELDNHINQFRKSNEISFHLNIKEENEVEDLPDLNNKKVDSYSINHDTKIKNNSLGQSNKSIGDHRTIKSESVYSLDDNDEASITTNLAGTVTEADDCSNVLIKTEYISDEEEREETEFVSLSIEQVLESTSSSDESSKMELQSDISDSIIIKPDGKLECKDCGKLFNKKYNLKRHIRSHRKIRPFICMVCGKKFSLKYTLEQHKRIHSGEKPYKCSECGKCFSVRSILTRHQLTHTGEKPFECEKCGKHFTQKAQLIQHLRAHIGVKAYECSICGRGFTEKRTLLNHTSGHNGLKAYPCSYCGKGFTHKSSMNRHKKSNCRVAKESKANMSHLVTEDTSMSHLVTEDTSNQSDVDFSNDKSVHSL